MPTITLALGSNIDPEDNLKAAATMLRTEYPGIRFSSVYRSAPLHHTNQDDFLNAVGMFEAENEPEFVYDFLRHVELLLGKCTPFRFGPRTIDLDLLLHGTEVLPSEEDWMRSPSQLVTRNPQLVLPHPRMHERRFVLEPLIELLPSDSLHPVIGKTWEELLKETLGQEVQRVRMTL